MSAFTDTPSRYGLVSRALHWTLAYLLIWQFVTVIVWRWFGEGQVTAVLSGIGPAHGTVGILAAALILPRIVWSLVQRRARPPAKAGAAGVAARAVHIGFYLLIVAVPSLALLRAYGSGKGLFLWGIGLLPATGREVAWLTGPANLLHAPLAWVLAALIALHVLAAALHGLIRRDGIVSRMAGPL